MDTEVFDLSTESILNSLNEGVYAVDTDRRIVYWGKTAEAITGWAPADVVGKCCSEGILAHVDKDGHQLCGEEYCPLHRAMVTGQASTTPIIVFARGKRGGQIPMRVSVAPIRDESGKVIGGVEAFQDLSAEFRDYQRVKKIQLLSIRAELPPGGRISFSTHYIPNDIVGGDYYAMARLDEDRYGFLLADVAGHGMPAALYTMYISSLWEANRHLLLDPPAFAESVNNSLCTLIGEDDPFAAGVCGMFDLAEGKAHLVGAGNPPSLLFRKDGKCEQVDCSGLPLGLMEARTFSQTAVEVGQGDCMLFFTDGAVEISDASGGQLGTDGLEATLTRLGYPNPDVTFKAIEQEMLNHSDRIRFNDDLTFLEVRLA